MGRTTFGGRQHQHFGDKGAEANTTMKTILEELARHNCCKPNLFTNLKGVIVDLETTVDFVMLA